MSDFEHSKLVVGAYQPEDEYVELFIDKRTGVVGEVDITIKNELIRRWNSHEALIEALEFLDNECDSGDPIRIGKAQIIVRRVVSRSQAEDET